MSDLAIGTGGARDGAMVAASDVSPAKKAGYQDADKQAAFQSVLMANTPPGGTRVASGDKPHKRVEVRKKTEESGQGAASPAPEGQPAASPVVAVAVAAAVAVPVAAPMAVAAPAQAAPVETKAPLAVEGKVAARSVKENAKNTSEPVVAVPVERVAASVHAGSGAIVATGDVGRVAVATAGGEIAPVVAAGSLAHGAVELKGAPSKALEGPSPASSPAAAPPAEEAKTLVSTPNVLEVGIANGTHGWLRVRAELGHGGEVQASFVAASDGAAQTLHKELTGMSAYLAHEQVGVSSLVVNATGKSGGTYDPAAGNGAGSAASSSGSGQAPGKGGTQADAGWDGPEGLAGSQFELSFAPGLESVPAALYAGAGMSGGWLSVRV